MDLQEAYTRLNCKQREAVDWPQSAVVLAGPGSGKTDTLAVKAAKLLTEKVRAPQGVACITYTRAAAQEIRDRVAALGVRPERRFFTGTVHSFCLQVILGPCADLVGEPNLRRPKLATQAVVRQLTADAMEQVGVRGKAQYWGPTLQSIRRGLDCGANLAEQFSEQDVEAAKIYVQSLKAAGLFDFDGLVHEALRITREHPRVSDLVGSAFPWLLVDEYQDLGGSLHRLVQTLREDGGVRVLAVGDPDQTIFQFTGADPRFLHELVSSGCQEVQLQLNYRSGPSLIRAATGALGAERGYQSDPKRLAPDGQVRSLDVDGGLRGQAQAVAANVVPDLLSRYPAEEIAILYRQKGAARDALLAALDAQGTAYSIEQDERFDTWSPVVNWLQRVLQYATEYEVLPPLRFRDLSDELRDLLVATNRLDGRTDLSAAVALSVSLGNIELSADSSLPEVIERLVNEFDLVRALELSPGREQELEALNALLRKLRASGSLWTVRDFCGPVRQVGKVVVTNYHSSKGRQFDAVVTPFMHEGFLPSARWRPWKVEQVQADRDRLLFYVGFTRARHEVVMLSSSSGSGVDPYGQPARLPRSRFVAEVVGAYGAVQD